MGCSECGGSQTTVWYEECDEEGMEIAVNRCIDPRCDEIDKGKVYKDDD